MRTVTILGSVLILAAVGCDRGEPEPTTGCAAVDEKARALLRDFGRCSVDVDCASFSLADRLELPRRGPCPIPFLCKVPVRADADREALVTRAQALVREPTTCRICPDADCTTAAEPHCDAATGTCRLR